MKLVPNFWLALPFLFVCLTGRAEPRELILQLVSDSDRPALGTQLEALRRQEKDLAAHGEKIKAENPTASALFQILANPNLTAAEREPVLAQLKQLLPELKTFQDSYDALSNARYDFFVKAQVSLAQEIGAAGESLVPEKKREAFRAAVEEIKKSGATYVERKPLFGLGKDTLRLTSIREVFDKSRQLLADFGFYAQWDSAKSQAQPEKVSKLRTLLNVARLVPAAVPMAWELYRSPYKKSPAGKAPLSDAMMNMFKVQGEVGGFKVDVVGAENMVKPRSPKDVVIYTPQHSNPFLDFVSTSQLDLKGSAFFGAADNFHMGKWAADRFEASDSFVMVGRGAGKPMEKVRAMLKSGKINKFILFPEGSLSGGLGETRPVRPGFIKSFVEELQKDGYNVTIVPISFPTSLRFDQTVDDPRFAPNGPRNLTAVVHAPLSGAGLAAIQEATGEASNAVYLLRQLYLEDSAAPGTAPGLPAIDSLLSQMNDRWGITEACVKGFNDLRGQKPAPGDRQ